MPIFGSTSSASSGLSFNGIQPIMDAGSGFRNWFTEKFVTPDGPERSGAGPAGNGEVGFITKSNSSASDEPYFDNNSFMEYMEGLLASTGQENVENRLFNASEAQKNRDWLTEMSNTSYQRAVADLQKAGLNPILAYQQGGASTPSSSSASYNVGGGDTLSGILTAFASLASSASDLIGLFTTRKSSSVSNISSSSTSANFNYNKKLS